MGIECVVLDRPCDPVGNSDLFYVLIVFNEKVGTAIVKIDRACGIGGKSIVLNNDATGTIGIEICVFQRAISDGACAVKGDT